MKTTLTVSSLTTLALLLFAAVQENFLKEWRGHQHEYAGILLERAGSEAERELALRFGVEIRQVVVPRLGHVDRCVSCHLGFDDPRMEGLPVPYGVHPGRLLADHEVDRFGCTVCHEGQGRATTRHEAHADQAGVYWERPLLPSPFTQSTCAACHDPAHLADRGAPALARGAELLASLGCQGCHKLDGRGGHHGPTLDGEGDKPHHSLPFAHVEGERTVWNWHRQHLKDPSQVVPDSRMPRLRLEDDEIDALTTYLLSLRRVDVTEALTPRDKIEQRYRRWHPGPFDGAKLYQRFCFACHQEGTETVLHDGLGVAVPSIRNPDFLAVAPEDFLLRTIRDGRSETEMPAWGPDAGGLAEGEMRAIIAFLLEERSQAVPLGFAPAEGSDPERGKELFEENCATCHGVTRDAEVCCIWLGSSGFQDAYSDALIGHTVKFGREGTLMIPFGHEAGGNLTDEDISDLVAFIRTLRAGRSSSL